VNIKIAGKWMFIPLKMVLIGIDPYPVNSILHGKKKGLFVGKYTVFVKQKKSDLARR